ncbi:MAG: hypothetical protein D6798_01905, partial [Deltaproteobacteria bacterium]
MLAFAWRWTRRLAVLGAVAAMVAAAVGAWAYQRYVVEEPGAHIQRDAILRIIAQESPVLYADGRTRIGVFFAREHREYVPYDRIPKAWVDAIVAAEDQRFFTHPGIDPIGIARAMKANLAAGRVVAGGSSLTQQTAKNLYYRPDRSLRSKWEELVNALRLEAHYSKEEILEFYANQFHVSANGRGLGIAARYFFDKDVEDLTTLECAFLAGMVKAPANYNPFLGQSEERRQQARARAQARTRYVLDRMLATGRLTPEEHDALVQQPIPFRKGTFRYDTNVILDEVAARLEQPPFPALFERLGIDNPSTAGIEVVTTIERDAQEGATWALWHHLTEVGPLIEGGAETWRGAASFRLDDAEPPALDPHDRPRRYEFRRARVTTAGSVTEPFLDLDLGGASCRVDGEGIERVATIVARARKGEPWRRPTKADVGEVLDALSPGSIVWVSVRSTGEAEGSARCDLELRPELQGAVMLLQDGRIRAMVGGNDNRNFNRAVTAKRQLGSTWKPVLYFAALQLGWAPDDPLDNRPGQAFHFEGSWYYPRPDHRSVPTSSLAWAGTRSENLASIWLLAHLLDRADPERFAEVAAAVDLVPREGEDRAAWIRRIRDDEGVISTAERLPLVAFTAARGELVRELWESGRDDEALALAGMFYGSGIEAELQRQAGRPERQAALRFNYLRLSELAGRCDAQLSRLRRAVDGEAPVPSPAEVALLRVRPHLGALQPGCGEQGEGWAEVGEHLLGAIADGVRLPLGDGADMPIEGRISRELLDRLDRIMARRLLVLQQADPWSLDVLQYHPDYRQLVGMRYLAKLAAAYGVQTELPPVLSLPLGAVDISVEEAASLYQGMLRGEAWRFPGVASIPGRSDPGGGGLFHHGIEVDAPDAATLLIAEIRDRDGAVLYRATPQARPLTEPVAGRLTGDILRNVVRWGTGRRANGAITLDGRPVPVAGKTGTTNDYRNAAFVGFVPRVVDGPDGPAWRWGEGYTLAVYVGYDDNRSMRRGGVRLQGASGALPAWILTAQALADTGLLGTTAPDTSEWLVEEGLQRVPVAEGSGLALPGTSPGAPVDDAGRSILVALERGIWGVTDARWRIFSPIDPAGRRVQRLRVPTGGGAADGDSTAVGTAAPVADGTAGVEEAPSGEAAGPAEVDGVDDAPAAGSPGDVGAAAPGGDDAAEEPD